MAPINPDYAQGKIYKITAVDGATYVGSTCIPLAKRFSTHKSNAKYSPTRPVYAHMHNVGWENSRIEIVESFPCSSRIELNSREHHWIQRIKPSLNTLSVNVSPGIAQMMRKHQYYLENQNTIKEKSRAYEAALRAKSKNEPQAPQTN